MSISGFLRGLDGAAVPVGDHAGRDAMKCAEEPQPVLGQHYRGALQVPQARHTALVAGGGENVERDRPRDRGSVLALGLDAKAA
jgi:hypothetical protein